jgi:hypothetical protein
MRVTLHPPTSSGRSATEAEGRVVPGTAPRRWYGRPMPCAVVFGATNEVRHYVVLKMTAAEVAVALGRARDEFGQFEDENGKSLWISARNVWYIEDRDDREAAQSPPRAL